MAALYAWLSASDTDDALVTFTGKVRNHNLGSNVSTLTLEHYPGITKSASGNRGAGARIVFVGVSNTHRAAAFSAAEYMMDLLKTRAPF